MSKSIKNWAKKLNTEPEVLENLVTEAEHEKEMKKLKEIDEKWIDEKYKAIEKCAKDIGINKFILINALGSYQEYMGYIERCSWDQK